MKENDGDAGKVPIKCIKSKMAQIQRYSNTIISLGSCTILVIRPVADKTLKTIVSTSLNLNQPALGPEMQKVADPTDISVLFFSGGANVWAIFGHFWAILAILGHFWVIFWC